LNPAGNNQFAQRPVRVALQPSARFCHSHTDRYAKRVIIALARKLLVIIYVVLKSNSSYDEQKFMKRKEATDQKRVTRMISELAKMGYLVAVPA
jgi:hypothetical protein